MLQDGFASACDRLSQIVDAPQFERLRWERNEAPMLARLVDLAQSALEGRGEFELTEEGATRDIKRFVVKVHGTRVMAITIRLSAGRAVMTAEAIDRSRFTLSAGEPISADLGEVDEEWMGRALQALFGRVQD